MSEIISEILTDVQKKIAPSDKTLETVRGRRDEVRAIAGRYPGALRTYMAGSIAHRTANDDTDADCGVVLDRRTYPELGPDGKGGSPSQIVEDVRSFIREELKKDHLDVTFRLTKRAIKITFNEPLEDGTDPSVDLIVALTRAERALWIPNLEGKQWDASDPEYHTQLLIAEPAELRRLRAKAIRLAKAWNKQYAQPGLCSFNISVLALEAVKEGMSVAEGLSAFFKHAASDLAKRRTPDPAGVSPPIKTLIDREVIVGRLSKAAESFDVALNSDNESDTRDAIAGVYWVYVEPSPDSSSKAAFAKALREGNSAARIVPGGLSIVSSVGIPPKTTRAYGGANREVR
ncbi:MAG: hypothetical protein FJ004_12310 [Chloroflexi bacterium]|nr:hypothetical protein [Chloroflexota bacterium]MBM4432796.1 hypothetical protein [Chloroflexota bacterium]